MERLPPISTKARHATASQPIVPDIPNATFAPIRSGTKSGAILNKAAAFPIQKVAMTRRVLATRDLPLNPGSMRTAIPKINNVMNPSVIACRSISGLNIGAPGLESTR